jgi:hypothetical protein
MSGITTATVAERPDLVDPGWQATRDVLPVYNDHGDVLNEYWPVLTKERADSSFISSTTTARSSPARGRSRSAGMRASRTCPTGSTARLRAASTRAAPTCSVRS